MSPTSFIRLFEFEHFSSEVSFLSCVKESNIYVLLTLGHDSCFLLFVLGVEM